MTEILESIRSETQKWHERAESLIPILSDGFSHDAYCRLLERFFGFYFGFESAVVRVEAVREILPDWRERLHVPRLEEDLRWLGYSDTRLRALPLCRDLPKVDSSAAAMGGLYVSEGSTLGGQIISRHLAKSLRVFSGAGATFFCGHGEKTGTMWRKYTSALCAVATPENKREIVEASVDTFRCVCQWLEVPAAQEHAAGQ